MYIYVCIYIHTYKYMYINTHMHIFRRCACNACLLHVGLFVRVCLRTSVCHVCMYVCVMSICMCVSYHTRMIYCTKASKQYIHAYII